MSHHDWSEVDFDWKGLNDCQDIMYKYGWKYGRLGGQIKEKYGTLRYYANFGWFSLHTLIYPGYCYCQFPKWLWHLDHSKPMRFLYKFLERPFFMWQKYWYNKAYQVALKKHPHLRAEILSSADHLELIKGPTRTEEDENEVRTIVLGWNGETVSTWVRSKK